MSFLQRFKYSTTLSVNLLIFIVFLLVFILIKMCALLYTKNSLSSNGSHDIDLLESYSSNSINTLLNEK